jgi:iron complex outermembrane receptor protein
VQNFDGGAGDWVGNQLVYQHRTARFGSLTLGTEANVDLRNMQYSYDVQVNQHVGQPKEPFRIGRSNVSYAVFAQHELNLGRRYTLYLGGRFDDTKNDKRFMSPRVALICKQSATSYKFIYGRAFRNPSTFERYWEPNPTLRAEPMTTLEFSREQNVQKRLTLVTSVFHYRLADLIGGVEVSEYVLQYRNKAKASATGVELELSGKSTTWLHAGGSLTVSANTRAAGT